MKIEKIILIVITSILILTAFEVKAEESINIDNSYASYRTITNCNGTVSGFTQLNLNQSSGNLTSNNAYNRPFLYQLRLFSQGDFKKSNSYTISYNINLSWINVNTSATPPNTQTYVDILKNANPKISARVDSGSSWLPDNIETYNVSYNYVSGNIVNIVIKFSLKQDAEYVGILFDWNGRNQCAWDGYFYEWLITALRLSAASGTYEMGTIGAIENQTNAIINGNNQINNNLDDIKDTITGDYEYSEEPTEQIQGKEEIDEMKELEENILGNIDLSATEDLNITINPQASKFIWDIVEQLRGINDKIIMLITSILGLGIIKMILNR